MFEKDAEEIAKDIYIHHFDDINYPEVLKAITVGVQEGAEFGYNKANEWHNVKDGLPTDTGLYLICYYNSFFNNKVRSIARYSPDRKEFLNLNIEDGDEVIAWQELPVPPKEIE